MSDSFLSFKKYEFSLLILQMSAFSLSTRVSIPVLMQFGGNELFVLFGRSNPEPAACSSACVPSENEGRVHEAPRSRALSAS